jgi:hypothetical protein
MHDRGYRCDRYGSWRMPGVELQGIERDDDEQWVKPDNVGA